jgi:hypothetical protein
MAENTTGPKGGLVMLLGQSDARKPHKISCDIMRSTYQMTMSRGIFLFRKKGAGARVLKMSNIRSSEFSIPCHPQRAPADRSSRICSRLIFSQRLWGRGSRPEPANR